MVHLRTVPDAWQARVIAARLGCEGIVTDLHGNVSGPYPFGEVAVLVEEGQAELAAALLMSDEVEAAFAGVGGYWPAFGGADGPDGAPDLLMEPGEADGDDAVTLWGQPGGWGAPGELSMVTDRDAEVGIDLGPPRKRTASRLRRGLAALAVLAVAGAPLLAHFFN